MSKTPESLLKCIEDLHEATLYGGFGQESDEEDEYSTFDNSSEKAVSHRNGKFKNSKNNDRKVGTKPKVNASRTRENHKKTKKAVGNRSRTAPKPEQVWEVIDEDTTLENLQYR